MGLTVDQEEKVDFIHEKYTPSSSRRKSLSKENSKDDTFLSPTLNLRQDKLKTTDVSKTITSITPDDFSKSNLSGQRKNSGGIQENKKTSSILSSFMSDFGKLKKY